MFSELFDKVLFLRPYFEKDLKGAEEYLRSFIFGGSILDSINPFSFSSGKRIRSILYFKFFEMFKSRDVDLKTKYKTIASIEAIHAASIIHDDVVDNSESRRGGCSFFKSHGIKKSILMGDYVLISIVKDFLSLHEDKVLRRSFLRECHAIAYGAVLEQFLTKDSSLQECIRVACLKTSALFKLACFLGGYLSSNDFNAAKKAATFGTCFGIVFQVQNDLNCYSFENFKDSEDYVQKNITIPIVILRDYFGYNLDEFFKSNQEGYKKIQELLKSVLFQKTASKILDKYAGVVSEVLKIN